MRGWSSDLTTPCRCCVDITDGPLVLHRYWEEENTSHPIWLRRFISYSRLETSFIHPCIPLGALLSHQRSSNDDRVCRRCRRLDGLAVNAIEGAGSCRSRAALPGVQGLLQDAHVNIVQPHILLCVHPKSPGQRGQVSTMPRLRAGDEAAK
jgi:hypothetical protein